MSGLLVAKREPNLPAAAKNSSAQRVAVEGNAKLPPHQNTVGHRWRSTLARAGVSGVRLHDLRHFYASGLIASGCDVVAVQRALGHTKSTTTLTTYAHLWPSAESRVRDASTRLAAEVLDAGEGRMRADQA